MSVNDCIFCGSSNTFYEFDDVLRCKDCWRIEVKAGSKTEENYKNGYWGSSSTESTMCFDHEFPDTGTKRSWCMKCDAEGYFDTETGSYKEDTVRWKK